MSASPTTVRFIPPKGASATITFNNRTYSCAAGSYLDVPLMDAGVLCANGWIQVAGSGSTAQRPANPFPTQLYHDNSLGYVVVWDGVAWRQPLSGSAV
jgi:hypothetical protein